MALQSKLQFVEKDNYNLKHHITDLEQSLKINKEIIDNLLQSAPSTNNLQTIIGKLRLENDRLYASHKRSIEKRE